MTTGPTLLTDPADPRLDDYRDLRTGGQGERATTRTVVVAEGLVTVGRLLGSRHPVRSVLVTPGRFPAVEAELGDLLDGTRVLVADRNVLAEVCGFDVHRGVLAAATRAADLTSADVVAPTPRIVVAEGLGDHENLGALFRTAAGLGVGGVLLDDRCADPLYRRSVRVSMGWTLRVPWARCGLLPDALAALGAGGHRTVGLSPTADATAVDDAAEAGLLDGPLALVVGAEGPGLTDSTLAACDLRVRVPMAEGVDSLNVATALGVVAAFAAARAGWPGTRPGRQP